MKSNPQVIEPFRKGLASTPGESQKDSLEFAAELILKSVGEDATREGLLRTPHRFSKAIREVCVGYTMTLEDAIGQGVFAAEGKGLVAVRETEFHSLCEHHLLPFYGAVSVAYYPNEKILGLSKIPRIVEVYSKRLQVQERLTREICEAIQKSVEPRAVLVRAHAHHLCMRMRGIEASGSETTTEFSWGLESLSEIERERLFKSVD